MVNNVGVVASRDIVALDQASVNLVKVQEGVRGTLLKSAFEKEADKFSALNTVNWSAQLVHAEKMGLGTGNHELIEVR